MRIVAPSLVRRVIYAVMPTDWFVILGVHTLYTAHVHAVLVGVGSALMVCVNSTDFAKIVFRRMGTKAVKRQCVQTFFYDKIMTIHARSRGPPAAAV
jgi:hypothetical protein